jgi:hypothetical protein
MPRRDPEPLQQSFRRPVLLTVTRDWTCPEAIAERALVIDLPRLAPENRRTEASLTHTFTEAWPAILGALCSAVATALHRTAPPLPSPQPLTPIPNPCFSDAFAWAVAASPALACTDEEMRQAFDPPPPPHPLVEAVRNLLEQRRQWTGSATELLDLLGPSLPGALSIPTPRVVSHHLKASILSLADSGIEVRFRRLPGGARVIQLHQESCDANSPNTPHFASQNADLPPQLAETEMVKP